MRLVPGPAPEFPELELGPVAVLSEPFADCFLASGENGTEGRTVTIGCGDPLSAGGPWVQVITDTRLDPPMLDELAARERDRLFNQAGIDEPEPTGVVDDTAVLEFMGVQHNALRRREGDVWVARTFTNYGLITVVARGVAADDIHLSVARDIQPYRAARAAHLDRLRTAAERAPTVDRPPGLTGHDTLVAYVVAEARTRLTAARRRRPRWEHHRLWEGAVLAQMHLAGQSRAEADAAVATLANHLSALAVRVDWWDGPDGAAAIAQTIRWTVFGSAVDSVPAQEAWRHGGGWFEAWTAWQLSRSAP